jgi:hypothetical protein
LNSAQAPDAPPLHPPLPRPRPRLRRVAEALALIVILGIAAGLRIGWPGTVEFKQDEANFSRFALDMVRGVEFPLLSIDSSVGIRNPPMTVYIMAVPYALSSDPVFATAYVGLLGTLAVLAFYALLRFRYGPLQALIGAALLAANPWMVMYSRKIWDLLPLFLILMLLTGLLAFARDFDRGRPLPRWARFAQLLHLPLLSVIGQIHYATVALAFVSAWLVWRARRHLTRWFWLSIPLAFAITLPFLIGAAREGYFNPAILSRIRDAGAPAGADAAGASALPRGTLPTAALMITGAESFSAPGAQRFSDSALTAPDTMLGTAAVVLMSAVTLLAALWLLIRRIRTGRRRDGSPGRATADGALLIALLGTPLLFVIPWTRLYTHYLLPVIPAALAIVAVMVGDLWRGMSHLPLIRRLLFIPIGAAIIGLVAFQTISFAVHITYVDRNPTPGVFSTPLRYYMPVRAYLLSQRPEAILATVEGQYVGYHTEASIWNLLLYDIPLRRFADDSIEVYPAVPTPFLSHRCQGAPGTDQQWSLRPGEACLTVQMRSKADYPAAQFTPIPGGMQLENGIAPVAYRWMMAPNSSTPCLAIAWAPRGPVPEDWQIKVHFLDSAGQVIAYGDGEFWRGRYWRAGDTIVKTHCLSDLSKRDAITGAEIGMYLQLPANGQFRDLNFIDSAGAALGPSIRLTLPRP